MQRILDNLLRRELQPLVHRDIREPGRLQHLQKHHVLSASVLNEMRGSRGNVGDVAGAEIECSA